MKFGAHCYIFVSGWSDSTIPVLDQARELGLDCLEIAIGDDVHFSPFLTRQRAEALGLELIVSPGGQWPMSCDLSSDDHSERRSGLDWHKKQIDLAVELGAVAYSGALYGHTGVVKMRRPPAEEFPRTAEGLHELAEYAESKDITIVLEPMSRFRTHIANTPHQLLQLIDLADHSNLRVLLDTYHMLTEVRDYPAAIKLTSDHLWGIHACENDRGVPGGGIVPWEGIFQATREIGFDGYIIMETYNSSLGDFAFERGMFHDVCPDGDAFVRRGLAFLKKCNAHGA